MEFGLFGPRRWSLWRCIYSCVNIAHPLSLQLHHVPFFKCDWGGARAGPAGTSFLSLGWLVASIKCDLGGDNWECLGGPDILPCLVQMSFRGLICLGIILLHVGLGEHWLPDENSRPWLP